MKHALALSLACLCAFPAFAGEITETAPDGYDSYQIAAYGNDLPIRVQVATWDNSTPLRATATSRVKGLSGLGWREIGQIEATTQIQVQAQAAGLKVTGLSNSSVNGNELFQGIRVESPHDQAAIQSDQGLFRGNLILQATKNAFSVVNELPLEQYLYSVVPSEMPASWPLEALKSQAVAARTYALSHLGQFRKRGFDVTNTTASQVYQGVRAEHANSSRAVAETRGLIMTHNNAPILAYFHSTSGGRTENGADLWAPQPYLQAVDDVDHASPKYTWSTEMPQSSVRARLRDNLKINVGEVLALQPLSYTRGGRIKLMRVLGNQGEQTVSGEKIRMGLGLNSTFFNVGGVGKDGKLIKEPARDKVPVSFQFAGRGWGHGMGMSQWGARQLAMDGHPFQNILGHYYRGVRIEPLNPSRYQLASSN